MSTCSLALPAGGMVRSHQRRRLGMHQLSGIGPPTVVAARLAIHHGSSSIELDPNRHNDDSAVTCTYRLPPSRDLPLAISSSARLGRHGWSA